MRLYHSPRGLYEFQATFSAYGVLRSSNLMVVDTGLGKTHICMATIATLFEDGLLDRAIVVVELTKLEEWLLDFQTFTGLSVFIMHGSKRTIPPGTQVVLTTYATFKLDFTERHPADARSMWLSEAAKEQPERMMVVYDEMAILGTSTTSQVYMAHKMVTDYWRERGELRGMGLTATPMTTSPINYFILGTILAPELVGTAQEWFTKHVTWRDGRGAPKKFTRLDEFAAQIGQIILRKRKTDPDVIDKFPKLIERFTEIKLAKAHRDAYDALEDHIRSLPLSHQVIGFRALLAFACHPGSILRSESEHLQEWVEEYGHARLAKLRSSKAEAVIPYLREILGQDDAGILVFCNSVNALLCLSEDLTKADIEHGLYHGQMTTSTREKAKQRFKAGELRVLLCSSAGERGINLPEAHYVVNFDVPPQHSAYLQRLNRASRIDAREGGQLVVKTYMAKDTIDHGAFRLWMQRNEWSDRMQDADALLADDPEFISSADRWELMRRAAKVEAA